MPRITAEVIAPPMPWMNRAPISSAWLSARPQTSDADVNTVSPARKMRRRPIRSPRRPTSSNSPPNAIRYALITHASADWEKCRSAWIVGSATFTIVWSRMIIRNPAHSTTSAIQRFATTAGAANGGCDVSFIGFISSMLLGSDRSR